MTQTDKVYTLRHTLNQYVTGSTGGDFELRGTIAPKAYIRTEGLQDCLYLNVFAPGCAPIGACSNLPVVVSLDCINLHGSGFMA